MSPRVDIVIVNWNSDVRLAACLDSVEQSKHDGFEIGTLVVVDNASTDRSELAAEREGTQLKRNPTNVGFAAACNEGASMTDGDYLLFLNPDMRLNRDSLAAAIAFMERPESDTIGVVGIALTGEDGAVAPTCARFPTPRRLFADALGLAHMFPHRFQGLLMKDWDHRETRRVDQVMGAFFLVRRPVYDALSGFDERFFMYFEEVDFSWRAREAGWTSWYLSETRAYHEGGGVSRKDPSRRLFFVWQSRILYAAKHFGRWQASGLLAATLVLEPLLRVVRSAGRAEWKDLGSTIGASARLWSSLPSLARAIVRGER